MPVMEQINPHVPKFTNKNNGTVRSREVHIMNETFLFVSIVYNQACENA